MNITAIYKNGVFQPVDAVDLPDNLEVQLSFEPVKATGGHPALKRLLEIAERFPSNSDAPIDRAAQHDHYLYGTPKRS